MTWSGDWIALSSLMSLIGSAAAPFRARQGWRNGSSTVGVASARHPAGGALADRVGEQNGSHLRRVWQVVGLWIRRRNDRVLLRSLSPRDIHDFCPKHSEAEAEMNKPFWRE